MPELLWKAYIDFELSEGEFERARELYERLLDRKKTPKGVDQYAKFEASAVVEAMCSEDQDQEKKHIPKTSRYWKLPTCGRSESIVRLKRRLQLKGKSDAADYEAESSDRSAAPGPGYTDHEVVTSPLQNPVSSKVGKANKTSRLTKCYENLWDVFA
ncbi:unnamed protein product [Prunus armeniaca]